MLPPPNPNLYNEALTRVLSLTSSLSFYGWPPRGSHAPPDRLQMVKKALFFILCRISRTLEGSPLRQIGLCCSTSTDIDSPSVSDAEWLGPLYVTWSPNPWSFVRYPPLSLSQNTTHFMCLEHSCKFLCDKMKINFELQCFVFMHHGINCHCNDTVSCADN